MRSMDGKQAWLVGLEPCNLRLRSSDKACAKELRVHLCLFDLIVGMGSASHSLYLSFSLHTSVVVIILFVVIFVC